MLTDDQNERIKIMLENLETVLENLNERSQDFVQQTIDRYSTYGPRLMFSSRQWDWLENLHAEFCPDAPPLPKLDHEEERVEQITRRLEKEIKRKQTKTEDPDDEIPF